MIYRNINTEIEPTPYELAEEFCDMDSDGQALFFKYISEITSEEWDRPFEFQVQNIIKSKYFDEDSKRSMRIFGDYSRD